jgi:hypothetical protein
VRTTLVDEGVAVHILRDKDNFTKRDLDRTFDALWNANDLAFILECYRIYSTLIFLPYCETGARLSAFFTGGLRYGINCGIWLLSGNSY